jgi:hypothetical protein
VTGFTVFGGWLSGLTPEPVAHVGTIAIRSGWGWSCGFYPGSHPGECTNGSAATEAAWRVFLSNRTEADYQEWRD